MYSRKNSSFSHPFLCYNMGITIESKVNVIKLVGITEIDEKNFTEYIDSWHKLSENISPSSCDLKHLSFCEWKKEQQALQKDSTLPEGLVRADTLFLIEENGYILGAINLRYTMNDDLLKFGGHMSFGIRPEERRKGYGFIMIKLAFNTLRSNGINRALITVSRDNKAAKHIVRKIGGRLENAYESKGSVIDRYWISL